MKTTAFILLLLSGAVVWANDNPAVDGIFQAWSQGGSPGASLGVFQNGQVIYARGYGLANLEYDIPNDADSVFRIGSTSKQFTAACIILLAQQDKLDLDADLHSFFPAFPDYAKDITVRHLLHHTSGIRDYLTLAYLKGLTDDDFYQDKDIMQWLTSQTELNFKPGEEHLYSNSGYWLLGQIVNQVAGMSMAEYAEQQIFKPLGMHHTHFHNNHKKIVKRRSSGYVPNADGRYDISMTTLDMIGDGGVFTTINDIKKWDDAYYRSTVLTPEFWQAMTTQGTLNNGETIDYAGGLIMGTYKGLKTISHGGAFVGFRAELLRFPEHKLSIAIFANRGDANPSGMAYQVAEVLLKEHLKQPPKPKQTASEPTSSDASPAPLSQLAGSYELQAGVQLKVTQLDDVLHVVQLWNGIEYDLNRTDANTFQIGEDASITFSFEGFKNDQAQAINLIQAGEASQWNRLADVDTSAVKLSDFVGDYRSEELDVVYHLRLTDDQLTVQVGNIEPLDLQVLGVDQLTYQGSIWRFSRTDGAIDGFTMEAGRVKNLAFKKQ